MPTLRLEEVAASSMPVDMVLGLRRRVSLLAVHRAWTHGDRRVPGGRQRFPNEAELRIARLGVCAIVCWKDDGWMKACECGPCSHRHAAICVCVALKSTIRRPISECYSVCLHILSKTNQQHGSGVVGSARLWSWARFRCRQFRRLMPPKHPSTV